MGNIIGIKLADGSFYPVMEEGKPFSKKLELTTVRDDQTTVQLHLYRSATGSMEDAEYVDTLLIENLVPHPKQENTLNLNINLDENNMLSAEIDDPETGNSTNSKVSLVTLGQNDIEETSDFAIPAGIAAGTAMAVGGAILADSLSEPEDDLEEIPEPIIEDIEESEPTFNSEFESLDLPEEIDLALPEDDSSIEIDSSLSDDFTFPEDDSSIIEETSDFAIPASIATGTAMAVGGAILADSLSEPNDNLEEIPEPIIEDIEESEPTFNSEFESLNLPEEIDLALPEVDSSTEIDSSLSDDFTFPEDNSSTEIDSTLNDDFTFLEDNSSTEIDSTLSDDFTFPEDNSSTEIDSTLSDNFTFPEDNSSTEIDSTLSDDFTFPEESLSHSELPSFEDFDIESKDSLELEDDSPFSFDSLPDFDEIPELQEKSPDLPDDFNAIDFEMPELDENQYNFATSNQSEDLLFDSLYEESYKETEKSQKRTTIPVIICVVCALICIGVLGIVLWITKPSLFGTKEKEQNITENIETQLPALEEMETIEPPIEDLTSAKVDTIVITPEPVIPEIPEPKEVAKPINVTYRIKWGDTLWDLADSYYQNPWLYPKIAKANNIKNPDLIISGTDIVIPPLN